MRVTLFPPAPSMFTAPVFAAIPLEIVTHEDLQMNERLRDYIEKKIDRLVRSLSNVISIRVDLSYNPAARNVDERASG